MAHVFDTAPYKRHAASAVAGGYLTRDGASGPFKGVDITPSWYSYDHGPIHFTVYKCAASSLHLPHRPQTGPAGWSCADVCCCSLSSPHRSVQTRPTQARKGAHSTHLADSFHCVPRRSGHLAAILKQTASPGNRQSKLNQIC